MSGGKVEQYESSQPSSDSVYRFYCFRHRWQCDEFIDRIKLHGLLAQVRLTVQKQKKGLVLFVSGSEDHLVRMSKLTDGSHSGQT